jgi:hypothetical protein
VKPSRNDLSAAIRVLLRRAGFEHFWTETGPTEEAWAAVRLRSVFLPGYDKLLIVCVAFDLWGTGDGEATVAELLAKLDANRLCDVASLLVELSNDEPDIQRWIESLSEE